MPWIDRVSPAKPRLKKRAAGKKIKWKNKRTDDEMNKAVRAVIYINRKGEIFNPNDSRFIFDIVSGDKYHLLSNSSKKQKYEVRVSVLDRNNNESVVSNPVVVKL